ncbi:MAG: EamA family transporter [Chloroflexi bacterium]|nr:EamA family transporter [Chloroflexota bacterium]
MGWAFAALVSAAIFSLVSVLDKRILAVYVPGIRGFYALVGVIQIGMAAVAILAAPWQGASAGALTAAVVSGALWGLVLLLLFYGLRALEVSRAVPFYNTFPVFVALLSMAFLGERLGVVHWLAILTVIAGAGLSTMGEKAKQGEGNKKLAYGALLAAALLTAAGTVTSKAALESMEFWNVFALRSLFLGSVLLLPGLTGEGRRQALRAASNLKGLGVIVFTEAILAPLGLYFMLTAFDQGPASLSSTIMSTRPIFTLLMSALLSLPFVRLLDEPLTRESLAVKAFSTVLVVGGVGALTLA